MFINGGDRARERERNIVWLPPIADPTGDRTHNPGTCPDQESNPQPSAARDDAPSNWATLARALLGNFNWEVRVRVFVVVFRAAWKSERVPASRKEYKRDTTCVIGNASFWQGNEEEPCCRSLDTCAHSNQKSKFAEVTHFSPGVRRKCHSWNAKQRFQTSGAA